MSAIRRINQVKIGAILSFVHMFLTTAIGLVYIPVVIQMLGQNEYGLYNTVVSTIASLSVLNLGFTSGYIRYYAKYKSDNDQEGTWKLNGMFLMIFTVLGLVALVCGVTLSMNIEWVFSTGLTEAEYKIARVLMVLLAVNLALTFPMGVFSNIISSNERYLFLKSLGIIHSLLSPILSVSLLLCGFRSIALVCVTLFLALVSDLFCIYYVLVRMKQKFWFRNFEKGLFTGLLSFTVFIALNLIVDQINGNLDSVLLARFKGTGEVAIYSVGYALYHYYIQFSKAVSSVFIPRAHSVVHKNANDLWRQREEVTALFTKVGRIQFIFLALVATGFAFFGKYFVMEIWAGEVYENSYYVCIFLMVAASIALIQNIGIEVQRAMNKHRFRSIAYICMAVCNLGISIVLCQKYGAIGCTIGTVISLVLANGLIMNIYYHKACNIDILAFWKSILRLGAGLVLPCAVGLLMMKYVVYTSVWEYILGIMVYTAIYALSMWFVGMNSYERDLIKKPLTKLVKR